MIHPDGERSPRSSLCHLLRTLLPCTPSSITSPSAPLFFHPLTHALFKCCASWIPAVQIASAGEIEFTHNLVSDPFYLRHLSLPSSLLISEMYWLYFFLNLYNSLFYSKQVPTEKFSLKLKYPSWTGCLMDYRWDSTAHTRAGWHCVGKYILRFVQARFVARYVSSKKSSFIFFLFCYCRLTSCYLLFQEKSSRIVQSRKKKVNEYLAHTEQPTETNALMPALSDTVSRVLRLPSIRCHVIAGQFPRWVLLKISWNHSAESSRELRSVKRRSHKSPAVAAICKALNIKTAITLLVWSQRRFLRRGC